VKLPSRPHDNRLPLPLFVALFTLNLMPATYTIKYLQSGHNEEIWLTRGIYYELADGSTLDVHTLLVWCATCRQFTDGEWIESPSQIRQQIAELNDCKSEAYQITEWTDELIRKDNPHGKMKSFRLSRIADLESRLEWSINRSSPPKCILCGNSDIFYPLTKNDNESEIEIPGLGKVCIEEVGISSTEFMNWYFTPEGDRIPRDSQPTYWGIPDRNK
jgi:hypothetical protein